MLYSKNIISVALVLLFSSLFCLLAVYPGKAFSGNVNITGPGGVSISAPVESYKEQLFDTVIRQKYDFSCGSAALATLLYHHYYYNVTEQDILKDMYAVGDQEKILKKGFSLLDMKSYLAHVGLDSDGYKMPLDKLQRAGVPSIALINHNGYLHFVVIKGIFDNKVLLGDPSLGLKKMDRASFEKMWNGIAFVIKSEINTGRTNFNLASDWNTRGKMYFDNAISQESLASYTTDSVFRPDYYPF